MWLRGKEVFDEQTQFHRTLVTPESLWAPLLPHGSFLKSCFVSLWREDFPTGVGGFPDLVRTGSESVHLPPFELFIYPVRKTEVHTGLQKNKTKFYSQTLMWAFLKQLSLKNHAVSFDWRLRAKRLLSGRPPPKTKGEEARSLTQNTWRPLFLRRHLWKHPNRKDSKITQSPGFLFVLSESHTTVRVVKIKHRLQSPKEARRGPWDI